MMPHKRGKRGSGSSHRALAKATAKPSRRFRNARRAGKVRRGSGSERWRGTWWERWWGKIG